MDDVAKRETSKLKAANSIAKKYPNWREVVWARLVHLKSLWLDHTAIAALTGARPEELRTAKVRKTASGIEIGITGAKVSDEKDSRGGCLKLEMMALSNMLT